MKANSGHSYAYANALFSLALAANQLAVWQKALRILALIIALPEAQHFYKARQLSRLKRAQVLLEMCRTAYGACGDDALPQAVPNLLQLLLINRRLELLPHIAQIYQDLCDAHNKLLRVKITSAAKLDANMQQQLIQKLTAQSGCQVELTEVIDSNLIAGAILHIKDKAIDSSLRGQLQRLRNCLIG